MAKGDISFFRTEYSGKRLVAPSTRAKNSLQRARDQDLLSRDPFRPKRQPHQLPQNEAELFDENPLDATIVIAMEDDNVPPLVRLQSEFYGLPEDILRQAANHTRGEDRKALLDWISWAQNADWRDMNLICAGVQATGPNFKKKYRVRAAVMALDEMDVSFTQTGLAARLRCSVSTVSRQVTLFSDVRHFFKLDRFHLPDLTVLSIG